MKPLLSALRPLLARVRFVVAVTLASAYLTGGVAAQLVPTQLSDLQAAGGSVENVQTVGDGAFTLYTADSTRSGRPELWSIDNANGTVQKLSIELSEVEEVAGFWPSPQGDHVAYEVGRESLRTERRLFVVETAGGPSTQLTGPALYPFESIRKMEWTVDGDRVVFSANLGDEFDPLLFSATADGSSVTEITGPIPTQELNPGPLVGFDVEGSDVVFWGYLETVSRPGVFSVPAEGGPRVNLGTNLQFGAAVTYAFIATPTDGVPTAVFAANNLFTTTLFATPVGGGPVTTLPEPRPFHLSDLQAERILYARDAGRIVYATNQGEVFSQPLGGPGAPVEMGSGDDPLLLQWGLTPDGARVLALERKGDVTELYSSLVTTGPPLRISSDTPRGTRIKNFVVTPSSDRIVYAADDRLRGREELFVSSTVEVGATRLTPVDFVGAGGVAQDYFLTPDGSRVIYRADLLENGKAEVFSVPIDGGESTRLNADLPSGADIVGLFPGPTDAGVFFTGAQDRLHYNELFSVDALGATPPVKVSGPLEASLGEVERFEVTSDGAHAVYLADQRVFNLEELWSVPSAGGTPVRLSPDLDFDEDVSQFQLAPDSQRVVMRIGGALWSSPVEGGVPMQLAPDINLASGFGITPDGQHVIAPGIVADNRISLIRIPIAGGEAVDLLPPSISSSDDLFTITSDGGRVIFAAPDSPGQTTEQRIYSVPVAGGEATRLSNLPLSQVLRFLVSADGSYVVFAARPADSSDLAVYGSPTDVPDTVELAPPMSGFPAPEEYPFYVDDDGSHMAYILNNDLFSVEVATGVTRNVTEGLNLLPKAAQFFNGGDALLVFRGPANETRYAETFKVDETGFIHLTDEFALPKILERQVVGGSLIMTLDPDSGNPLTNRIVFEAPLGGKPGMILSAPDRDAQGPLQVDDDFVTYRSDSNTTYAAPRDGGPPILLRPAANDFEGSELRGRYFYLATEPDNPLVELYSIDIATDFIFSDGFELGDTSRWSAAIFP